MLLATPENMEKCKDIPGVVALDISTGESFGANAGDYFSHDADMVVTSLHNDGISYRLVLAVKVCHWVDPITGVPLPAQITAEEN